MMSFLKNLFSGDKCPAPAAQKSGAHDVMMIGGDVDEAAEEEKGGCESGGEYSGCGGCGCRR